MNFTNQEWKCKCGCGTSKMKDSFKNRLESARMRSNVPFVLTSAYRCPKHNAAVGGSPTSSHLAGCAVDILANSSSTRMVILSALIGAGFRRIGIDKVFIHVDMDSNKVDQVCWLY